jgi:alkaline phosphatase
MKMRKKLWSLLLIGTISLVSLTGCTKEAIESNSNQAVESSQNIPEAQTAEEIQSTEEVESIEKAGETAPKYVFLFIGDGMSYPQVQITNYFLSASANSERTDRKKVTVDGTEKEILESKNQLTMLSFPITGSAQTYDSTSFAPDSASTATSIATGKKTWSGSINVSTDFTEEYETIAEQLKAQKNYKIGIISTVNLNHATPAAFYAHQTSRDNYYEIGLELIESNFDYFAGGALKKPTGANKDQTDLYELAAEQGYRVIKTQDEAQALTANDGKSIVISEKLADSDSMPYDIDREAGELALADYVEKGIEVLDNDAGFFMMVEGGKIDWACHANDAASTITETVAFDKSVEKAVEFYKEHPTETLIIVTGDHETGGLTIGFAGTDYDTFLTNLHNQKISYAKFDTDYVDSYKENKAGFEDVMKDVEELFGLEAPDETTENRTFPIDSESSDAGTLVMTPYEYEQLKDAYELTLKRTGEEEEFAQDEYVKYGKYEPLTVTITHILNNKSGINFGSYSHTGLPVEVLVQGVGAESFDGYYDNTDIYKTLAQLTGVQ